MKKRGVYLGYAVGILGLFSGMLMGVVVNAQGNDRLNNVFEEAQDYGYSSDADADDLFETKLSIGIGNGDGDGDVEAGDLFGLRGSVIARTIQFFLRITVIVSIPMIIYVGIKVITSMGDEEKLRTALKEIGMVTLGLFLALMSVVIVYLILSITRSNVDAI